MLVVNKVSCEGVAPPSHLAAHLTTTHSQSSIKSPFSAPQIASALTETRQLVVQINAIEK